MLETVATSTEYLLQICTRPLCGAVAMPASSFDTPFFANQDPYGHVWQSLISSINKRLQQMN
jgi:hypothetical protein